MSIMCHCAVCIHNDGHRGCRMEDDVEIGPFGSCIMAGYP